MKRILRSFFLLSGFLFLVHYGFAQCGTNKLANNSFEMPVVGNINANNFPANSSIAPWTIMDATKQINIINATGSYPNGPSTAQNGNQYLDIVNSSAGFYQVFTVTSGSANVAFGGYFSSRDNPSLYVPWTAQIKIYSESDLTTPIAVSNSRSFTSTDAQPANLQNWYLIKGTTTFTPGTYRYVVDLGDYGNFDNAYVFEDCIMPVVLGQFSGTEENNNVSLHWTVETQTDLQQFEVEKSTDLVSFSSIGIIHPSSNKNYSYQDNSALNKNAVVYYRLKMLENNGKSSYSQILSFKSTGSINNDIFINPNPVHDFINLSGLQKGGTVKIMNQNGQETLRTIVNAQTFSWNVSVLSPGVYFLQYFRDGKLITKKFIKN